MDLLTQPAINELTGTMHTVASAMSGGLGSELGLAWFSPMNMRKGASTLMLVFAKTPPYRSLCQPLFLPASAQYSAPALGYS